MPSPVWIHWPKGFEQEAMRVQAASEDPAAWAELMADPVMGPAVTELMSLPSRPPITLAERQEFGRQEAKTRSQTMVSEGVLVPHGTIEVENEGPNWYLAIERRSGRVFVLESYELPPTPPEPEPDPTALLVEELTPQLAEAVLEQLEPLLVGLERRILAAQAPAPPQDVEITDETGATTSIRRGADATVIQGPDGRRTIIRRRPSAS